MAIYFLGHRGSGKTINTDYKSTQQLYQENSEESIIQALQSGADGVEIDLRVTKDEKIVVCHSDQISKLFDLDAIDITIKDLTLSEIKGLQSEKKSYSISTLEEVIQSFERFKLDDKIIELEPKDTGLAQQLLKIYHEEERFFNGNNVYFVGYDAKDLKEIKESIPACKTGLSITSDMWYPDKLTKSQVPDRIYPNNPTDDLVKMLRNYNIDGLRSRQRDFLPLVTCAITNNLYINGDIEFFDCSFTWQEKPIADDPNIESKLNGIIEMAATYLCDVHIITDYAAELKSLVYNGSRILDMKSDYYQSK